MYECVYVYTFIELIMVEDETEQRQSDRESMRKNIAKKTGGKEKRDLPTSRCGVCVYVSVCVCLCVWSRTLAVFRDLQFLQFFEFFETCSFSRKGVGGCSAMPKTGQYPNTVGMQ